MVHETWFLPFQLAWTCIPGWNLFNEVLMRTHHMGIMTQRLGSLGNSQYIYIYIYTVYILYIYCIYTVYIHYIYYIYIYTYIYIYVFQKPTESNGEPMFFLPSLGGPKISQSEDKIGSERHPAQRVTC